MIYTILFIVSCGSSPSDINYKIYDFRECESILLSELFMSEKPNYMELEDPDSIWLSTPSIVKSRGEYIAVCQPFGPMSGVWLYDVKGGYLGRLGNIGRGPGEYIFPKDVLFSPSGDMLYVVDGGNSNILSYTTCDRKFQETQPFPLYAMSVTVDPYNGDFVWYVSNVNSASNNRKYKTIVRTTTEGKTLEKTVPVEQLDCYSGMWQIISNFHDSSNVCMAHHQFQPEIFSTEVGDDSIIKLQFENHKFPPISFAWGADNFRELISSSPYIQYYDVFQTSHLLYVRFGVGGNIYIGVYDKRKQYGCYCSVSNIEDDLGIGVIPRIKGVQNDRFYFTVTPEQSNYVTVPMLVNI